MIYEFYILLTQFYIVFDFYSFYHFKFKQTNWLEKKNKVFMIYLLLVMIMVGYIMKFINNKNKFSKNSNIKDNHK